MKVNKKVSKIFEKQDLNAIDRYLKDRLDELDSLAQRGDPWVFGACCTFIEMLAERENPQKTKSGNRFKKFVQMYLMPSNSLYQDAENKLKEKTTKQEFPEISKNLWNVLRCGVVHSFSMKDNKDKKYKILLGHRKNSKSCTSEHLNIVDVNDNGKTYKALLIIAEDFVEDLRKCTQKIIEKAKQDPSFCDPFKKEFSTNPPFGWLTFDEESIDKAVNSQDSIKERSNENNPLH
jgi:hypothetical protein